MDVLKKYIVGEILETGPSPLPFTVSYTDIPTGNTKTFIDSDTFMYYVGFFASERIFFSRRQTANNAYVHFLGLFNNFFARNEENIARSVYALEIAYNPLENYDRLEEGTETETHTNGERHGATTTTINARNKDKTSVYGDNSAVAVPDTESESEITYKDGTTGDVANTTTDESVDTIEREYTGRRTHGNIGVTAPYQLIEGELSTRKTDLVKLWLDRFFDEYTVFC